MIEESDKHLPLRDLAQRTGLSEHHFHRVFKKITGLTPKSYATACRNQKLKNELNRAASVTEAIYNAGYASNSRFYDTSSHAIGMTATAYRQGGVNMEIRFAVGECKLGAILVAQSERGICAILLGDDAEELVRDLQNRFPKAALVGGDSAFEHTVAKVVGIIQTPGMNLDMPLDINGTAFQQRVWQVLRKIPFGKTVSYAELARLVGAPKAVRAVASACAANAHAIAIPCHRVVRTDGSLSGYRWGIERKRSLIDMELQGKIEQDKK
jgi:AraC family transcriptional regulator of adaptative response/methylated-DNA-[protein]-cysteine methyltransferase